MRHIIVCILFIINVIYFFSNNKLQKKENILIKNDNCIFIGGFYSEKSIIRLQQHFYSLAVDAQIVKKKIKGSDDFLVYLPTNENNNIVFSRIFREKNISNTFITSGDWKDNISFGIFANKENALQKVDEINKHGYDPQITQIPRIYHEYWLKIFTKDKEFISEKKYQSILKILKNTKEEILPCNSLL